MSRPKKIDSMTNAERQKKYRQQLKARVDILESVSGDMTVKYCSARNEWIDNLKSRCFPLNPNDEYQMKLV
jgi:hypothetical protein